MVKPTTLPRFADEDKIDTTSGQNNVVEPENDPHKRFGWDFKEQPPRNFFNWLHRWTYRWLNWLDTSILEGVVPVRMYDSGGRVFTTNPPGADIELVGGELHFNIYWKKVHDIVMLFLITSSTQECAAYLNGAIGGSFLRIAPRTPATWPDAFIKITWDAIPIVSVCDTEKVNGIWGITPLLTGSTNDMFISCSQPSTQGNSNNLESGVFGTTALKDNGFMLQPIVFRAPTP